MWYSKKIMAEKITLVETARSGIWYTDDIVITNSMIQAPKTFRRSSNIKLDKVELPNAEETLWNCSDIVLNNVTAVGKYFGMNSKSIVVDHFHLSGNYGFDGGENIEIDHAHIISKDCFWNCKNVVVRNSTIIGEYLGWNSKNVTFINCTIESNQGMCYMDNLKMIDCRLIHTDLAFEYSTVHAEISTPIESIKNPISGRIEAESIGNIIFDDPNIQVEQTKISVSKELADHV